MTKPTQSIYVETQALYNCAFTWRSEASPKLATAKTKATNGEGQGYLFGVLLASLQQPHDDFATAAAGVLGTGGETSTDMGDALEQVAKDYEATDANISTLMTKQEAGL